MVSPVLINFYYVEDEKNDITSPAGLRHLVIKVASSPLTESRARIVGNWQFWMFQVKPSGASLPDGRRYKSLRIQQT